MAHSGTARADSGSGRTRLIHAVFDSLLTLIWVSAVAVQALPSCSPGNGILRAETGGGYGRRLECVEGSAKSLKARGGHDRLVMSKSPIPDEEPRHNQE